MIVFRNHTPTRLCPHRLCRPLHTAYALLALVVIVLLLVHGTDGASLGQASGFWLFLVILGFLGYAISRVVTGRSPGQLAKLDQADRLLGVVLVVRPAWAAIAAGLDGLMLAMCGLVGATLLSSPGAVVSNPGQASFGGVAIGLGICAFQDFAHMMAARPVKPKRVTVLAMGSGGA
jgi:hypothetical protein